MIKLSKSRVISISREHIPNLISRMYISKKAITKKNIITHPYRSIRIITRPCEYYRLSCNFGVISPNIKPAKKR